MAQQLTQMMASLETTDDGQRDQRKETQIYAKNSMDRFGDDMFGLILSYLSLEDRFRCECVSKQFQRTVFGSVVDITLSDRLIRKLSHEKRIKTQLFAKIAIKCVNIQTIDCRGITAEYNGRILEVLNAFRDNCHNLREIYCNPNRNMGQTMGSLWPLITRIGDIKAYISDSQVTDIYHRLYRLIMNLLDEVFDKTTGQLMAKNLKEFELNCILYDNNHRLSTFVAHNQSLRSLYVSNNLYHNYQNVTEMCGQLSLLTQLRELTVNLVTTENVYFGLNHYTTHSHISFGDILMTIAVNCKQLKRLSFVFHSRSKDYTLKTLDSLRYFRRLKRLRLTLYVTVDEILLEPLRHCRRLTHLDIDFIQMNAKVAEIVVKCCPRLQYLCVHYKTCSINTQFLDHISRLPALQMLVIQCHGFTLFNDIDFWNLLSSSPKLKTIEIRVNNEKKFYSKSK